MCTKRPERTSAGGLRGSLEGVGSRLDPALQRGGGARPSRRGRAGDLLALRACAQGVQGLGRPGRGRGRLMSRLSMGCLSLEGHGGAGVASARRPSLSLSLSPSLMGRPRRGLDSEASAWKPSLSSSSKAWKGLSSSLSPCAAAPRDFRRLEGEAASRAGASQVSCAPQGAREARRLARHAFTDCGVCWIIWKYEGWMHRPSDSSSGYWSWRGSRRIRA